MLLFIHILSSALWLGSAATLPFWGNRMNRADHLNTVLSIIDTIFILKCVLIMGGLIATLTTGVLLLEQLGLLLLPLDQTPEWLLSALVISLIILVNSCVIFYFMIVGRRGKRSLMRLVPPIGYTNIGLISFVFYLMAVKPVDRELYATLLIIISLILIANLINIMVRTSIWMKIKNMSAKEFADFYFKLLNEEKMTDLFKLFHDDAKFIDPFATGPIIGILAIERFFQQLGDQFDTIKIIPQKVTGSPENLLIHWEAQGITKNGITMNNLSGTNNMKRRNGKIFHVDINFSLDDLPQIQRVTI